MPPHLQDEYEEKNKEAILEKQSKHIGKQWPSKYGPGWRKAFKAKQRKDRAKK
jgi:hypothetical protein